MPVPEEMERVGRTGGGEKPQVRGKNQSGRKTCVWKLLPQCFPKMWKRKMASRKPGSHFIISPVPG